MTQNKSHPLNTVSSSIDIVEWSPKTKTRNVRLFTAPLRIKGIHTYIHTHHSRFIPEGVAEVS
jgi:hypothetical protein